MKKPPSGTIINGKLLFIVAFFIIMFFQRRVIFLTEKKTPFACTLLGTAALGHSCTAGAAPLFGPFFGRRIPLLLLPPSSDE